MVINKFTIGHQNKWSICYCTKRATSIRKVPLSFKWNVQQSPLNYFFLWERVINKFVIKFTNNNKLNRNTHETIIEEFWVEFLNFVFFMMLHTLYLTAGGQLNRKIPEHLLSFAVEKQNYNNWCLSFFFLDKQFSNCIFLGKNVCPIW